MSNHFITVSIFHQLLFSSLSLFPKLTSLFSHSTDSIMNCFNIFTSKTKRKPKPSPKPSPRSAKSTSSIESPRSIVELYNERGHNLRKFSFSELRNATNNFNRSLKIGEGGFGSVYKGTIRPVGGHGDPVVVAIKKLRRNGMQVLWQIIL